MGMEESDYEPGSGVRGSDPLLVTGFPPSGMPNLCGVKTVHPAHGMCDGMLSQPDVHLVGAHGVETTGISKRVYVASSWRNPFHGVVIGTLKAAEIEHYNFREPGAGRNGFGWGEVMPSFDINSQEADVNEYLAALDHPRAVEGYTADYEAMQNCDTFVMVLPCGKSAHLELGWAAGAGRRTAILLDSSDPLVQPELMYKMADLITSSVMDLLAWLGVKD